MVSVIIAAYNAEKYLAECIESIINQNYKNIEIVLVDDGSTDNTQAICMDYSRIDTRIRYIRKKNGGVSSARNEGIRNAKGEFITFVDADDYLDNNIIASVVKKMEDQTVDLVGWNTYRIIESEIQKCKDIRFNQDDLRYIRAALISNYHGGFYCGDYIRGVWGKLFRSNIIFKNNIFFDENLYIGEDSVFLMEYILNARKVTLVNEFGYYYRILDTSAVRRYKADLLRQIVLQFESYERLLETDLSNPIINNALCVLQWTLLHDLLINEKRSGRKLKQYEDVCAWYAYMRKKNMVCTARPKWAAKIVQIQIAIGIKIPCSLQITMMELYDRIRNLLRARSII